MAIKVTEEYLKIYKEQIRRLPLDELYEVLDIIRKDDSPERQNIVKTRIAKIENEENAEPNFVLSEPSTEQFQADTESDDSSNHEITQEEINNYNNTQLMPDTNGLIIFLLLMAIGLGTVLLPLILISINENQHPGYHNFKITAFLPFLKYVPITTIFIVNCITAKERIRDYWVNHLKLALSIASFLAVNAAVTFYTGTYSGICRDCTGRPAYLIAAGLLIFSILFIANAFYPISKKYRPKNGLTLAALALVLETALR